MPRQGVGICVWVVGSECSSSREIKEGKILLLFFL
jgi:hypothetical protein